MNQLTIVAFVLVGLASTALADPLLIGAFNVQIFGQSKMNEPEVVDVLVKVGATSNINALVFTFWGPEQNHPFLNFQFDCEMTSFLVVKITLIKSIRIYR